MVHVRNQSDTRELQPYSAAAVERAAAAAAEAAKAAKVFEDSTVVSPDAMRVRMDIGALTAANHRAELAKHRPPELSEVGLYKSSTVSYPYVRSTPAWFQPSSL
jgi:hypothetical protein